MISRERGRTLAVGSLVGVLALLPFVRGLIGGRSFYFRDLSLYFFPLRRFVVEGLRAGEVRFWNPYVHEGVPLSLLPISYLPDLLQTVWPTEAGFSALLALHFPLAAIALFALCRHLGQGRAAAAVGGLVYAFGGFALSTLNLYVYVQALAWAPLVALTLMRAAEGTRRSVAVAAAVTAMALSTTAVEVVAQAIVFGLVLAMPPRRGGALRLAGALALAAGLSAVPLVLTSQLVGSSERGAGFTTDVVLAHSIHPMTFAQVLVAGLYGDTSRGADAFWGQNFFPRGFPYFLSLYLGATVVAMAVVGVARPGRMRRRLAALVVLGVLVCLGRWGGWQGLVEALPPLHRFRFPSKAFFTVHLATALLAARGTDTLATSKGEGGRWPAFAIAAIGLGAALVTLSAIPALFPRFGQWFLVHFFPGDAPWAARVRWTEDILEDAARGGLIALVAGLVGLGVVARRMACAPGAVAVGILAVTDLLRAGAGLNPMVTPAFFKLSPEMEEQAVSLRRSGRIFTCDVSQSPAYLAARGERLDHEAWSFAVLRETLTPNLNLLAHVPTALSLDLTMLVPRSRVIDPDLAACRDPDRLLPRLKAAGVAHFLTLDPVEHPDLELTAVRAPREIAPLRVHVYQVLGAEPLFELRAMPPGRAQGRVSVLSERAGWREFRVETDVPAVLIVREGFDAGWSARIDGQAVDVVRTAEDQQGVPLSAGPSLVTLTYRPPGLGFGLVAGAGSFLVLRALGVSRPAGRPFPAPSGHDASPAKTE